MTASNREIEPIEKAWAELVSLVDSLGSDGLTRAGGGQWAVKDHLVHIAVWERSTRALLDGEDRLEAMGIPGATGDTDAVNEAVWLAHRDMTPEQAKAYWLDAHSTLMARLSEMSDADLRRSYNHYQPNDPRDSNDDRPVVEWVAGNTYDHYGEHAGWIKELLAQTG